MRVINDAFVKGKCFWREDRVWPLNNGGKPSERHRTIPGHPPGHVSETTRSTTVKKKPRTLELLLHTSKSRPYIRERNSNRNLVGPNVCPLITHADQHDACAVANASPDACARGGNRVFGRRKGWGQSLGRVRGSQRSRTGSRRAAILDGDVWIVGREFPVARKNRK